MRMRLMLLGGGNALGQALIRLGSEEDIEFLAPRPPESGWDVASLTEVLDESRPDVVINLAYYHDWFQAKAVDSLRLNHQEHVVRWLAVLCQQRGVILVQPSSYRLFDGTRTMPYGESDIPAPLDARGHLFMTIEQALHALCHQHVIIRFGWLLDDSPEGWLGRFLAQLEQEKPLSLADDRRGQPTPVEDAASAILAVLKQLDCKADLWGTYQYGGYDAVSQLILGQAVLAEASIFGRVRQKDLLSRPHVDCPDSMVEPQHAVLACKKITHTFGIKPRPWRAALPTLMDSYYRHV
ncbi:dTDP-4-dehydrorhamnose reductase [Azomonas agilis]|uniref:dTDP-4-dehydrorhamnose reductase n=1 Tax=Azomonas agilis TaxID=116849 RepID=A0A562J375_9GAMM|nr:sugar nucleotide-binding protein [Azomonas agilis]TWH77275.1 dTDP-4-dehydrorhamnose reductase [Azomonas agilis]